MTEPLNLKFSWPYPRGIEFKHVFEAAEFEYNIPFGLLARQAWQESRFREDIITGKKVSSANAQGIMQIVPRWHPDVNPLDPIASIKYAAKYDAQLYKIFGTWELALAAYNWGPNNVMKHRNMRAVWPDETTKYASEILSDAYEILASLTTSLPSSTD
jgi:soluble lytic murein transglycosylase-like protein